MRFSLKLARRLRLRVCGASGLADGGDLAAALYLAGAVVGETLGAGTEQSNAQLKDMLRFAKGDRAGDGPADLRAIRAVAEGLGSTVALVTNGNVRNFEDARAATKETSLKAVMSAEGLLDDPARAAGGVRE